MARTKQEVRNFMNSQVGQKVNSKAGVYNGQCVSLIKALLEFLGVPNPYSARGNAKDVGDTLLRQGHARNGQGWLMVAVNRSMGNIGGVTYGHCWIDLQNEANFEQNGNRALLTTKNTRPIQQAQQLINLDQYIKADAPARKSNDVIAQEVVAGKWGNGADRVNRLKNAGYDPSAIQAIVNRLVSGTPSQQHHTVVRGDTMSAIASRYGTTLANLSKLNPSIKNLNLIHPGQKVRVR
jgi:LysM repeat protein